MRGILGQMFGATGDKIHIWVQDYHILWGFGVSFVAATAYIQYNIHTKAQYDCVNMTERVVVKAGDAPPMPYPLCVNVPFTVELPDSTYINMGIRK